MLGCAGKYRCGMLQAYIIRGEVLLPVEPGSGYGVWVQMMAKGVLLSCLPLALNLVFIINKRATTAEHLHGGRKP